MSTELAVPVCTNKDCKFSQDGSCVEGYAIDKCPHISRTGSTVLQPEAADAVDVAADATDDSDAGTISLSSGACLTAHECSAVLRLARCRVIAIVGPTNAGKTSLVSSVYQLFQFKPQEKFSFARSRTLVAFEQACHNSRASSERTEPDMETTPHNPAPSGVTFYHLGLFSLLDFSLLDFLLADRTGREYSSAADDPALTSDFVEIERADSITVLVDGKRLLDLTKRHNVLSEITMILQGLFDGGKFNANQRLLIVLTKLDDIHRAAKEDKQRAEADFERLVEQCKTKFATQFDDILSFKIAASPKSDVLPYGYGVNSLLETWALKPKVRLEASPKIKTARAFGRLQMSEEPDE